MGRAAKYTGSERRLNTPIPASVHQRITELAAQWQKELNQYVSKNDVVSAFLSMTLFNPGLTREAKKFFQKKK